MKSVKFELLVGVGIPSTCLTLITSNDVLCASRHLAIEEDNLNKKYSSNLFFDKNIILLNILYFMFLQIL